MDSRVSFPYNMYTSRRNIKRQSSAEYCLEQGTKQPNIVYENSNVGKSKYQFFSGDTFVVPIHNIYSVYDDNFYINGRGLIIDKPYVIQLEWKKNEIDGLAFIVNINTKRLVAYYKVENNIVKNAEYEPNLVNQILTVNHNGERWEGQCFDTISCGWGEYYNENNQLVYRGFQYNFCKICYGTEFFPDCDRIRYEGTFCYGMYCGQGILYNIEGNQVGGGEWIQNEFVLSSETIISQQYQNQINSLTNRLCFRNSTGSYIRSLHFAYFWKLEEIQFGDFCMTSLGSFEDLKFQITDLPLLRLIRIGDSSFVHYRTIHLDRTNLSSQYISFFLS